MHIAAIRHSDSQIARALSRVKVAALEWAAILSMAVGLGAAAAAFKAMAAAELRFAARHTRALLLLAALKQVRPPRSRACTCAGAPAGAIVRRQPRGSVLRLFTRAAFARSGLSARDPAKLAAAIAAVIAQRARYVARLVKRIARGLALFRLVTAHPPAIVLHSAAPPAPVCAADTS
jgi:hypothetical protein